MDKRIIQFTIAFAAFAVAFAGVWLYASSREPEKRCDADAATMARCIKLIKENARLKAELEALQKR